MYPERSINLLRHCEYVARGCYALFWPWAFRTETSVLSLQNNQASLTTFSKSEPTQSDQNSLKAQAQEAVGEEAEHESACRATDAGERSDVRTKLNVIVPFFWFLFFRFFLWVFWMFLELLEFL